MEQERFNQLYSRILENDNWDYSTLDELLSLSKSDGRDKGAKEGFEQGYQLAKKEDTILIASDIIASSFQSTGQYRTFLLEKLA